MRRNQTYFNSLLEESALNEVVSRHIVKPPISVSVPICFPQVAGYMTLLGLNVDFYVSRHISIEYLNIGRDVTNTHLVMKKLLTPL